MNVESWCLELFKAALALLVTVVFGSKVVAAWQMRNKRRELDIIAATQFQQIYGEYKQIWRLWKIYQDPDREKFQPAAGTWWILIDRAAAAEARLEALVVKLVVERRLTDSEINSLGLFRQGFQQLRQGIRESNPLKYSHEQPEYRLFNKLATEVACILLTEKALTSPDPGEASEQLTRIVNIRQEDWCAAVKAV